MNQSGKVFYSTLLFLFILFQNNHTMAQAPAERPKLVVGIVVDQMRWDYLYRYKDRYGEGGFKRMLNEGFTFENTFISHLPSFTAVGHSTVYTGSVPAIHGIIGNDWPDQVTGRHWYCTEDTAVTAVGCNCEEGQMSPRNLLASTITDELKIATNFNSKVVGVSLKDRASILPAGHTPDGAFWLDDASGNFITSSYYMNDLPSWVKKFNKEKRPQHLMSKDWETLYPISSYTQSTQDNVSWEGPFKDETAPVFPHHLKDIYAKSPGSLRATPFGNTLTLDLAKAAVNGYELGKDNTTDFLTINCASTDYVGHQFGPNSIEVEDTYLRLDKDLAAFFSFLDEQVGKGNYVVFLTADHGAANAVGFMQEHHLPAGLVTEKGGLNNWLYNRFGVVGLARGFDNYHVSFNLERIDSAKLDYDEVKKTAVRWLVRQPGIQLAADLENAANNNLPEPIRHMALNGYNPKRCGPVIVIPEPGWYQGALKGTTHGNWNPYDIHIPLVFMGWHVPHGASTNNAYMVDIAPTVAALLHIQMPNGNVGNALNAYFLH